MASINSLFLDLGLLVLPITVSSFSCGVSPALRLSAFFTMAGKDLIGRSMMIIAVLVMTCEFYLYPTPHCIVILCIY